MSSHQWRLACASASRRCIGIRSRIESATRFLARSAAGRLDYRSHAPQLFKLRLYFSFWTTDHRRSSWTANQLRILFRLAVLWIRWCWWCVRSGYLRFANRSLLCFIFSLVLSRTHPQSQIAHHLDPVLRCCRSQLGSRPPQSMASWVGCPGSVFTREAGGLMPAIGHSNHLFRENLTLRVHLPDFFHYWLVVVANRS